MASAILTPTSSFCLSSLSSSSPSSIRIQSFWTLSNSVVSVSQHSNFKFYTPLPQLGLCEFPPWNGLKHLGISISQQPIKLERKGNYKGKGVYASLFGVGAPEALVIGVVALLVFGPKGLAEVARNLGKTLRAFQPTIRELQDVSREFKSTLEREIGLDEIQTSSQKTFSSNPTKASSGPSLDAGSEASRTEIDPNGSPSPSKAFSSEEFLKISEEQLRAAAAKQQEQNISPGESPSEIQSSVASQQMDTGSSGESQSEIQTQPQVVSDSPQEAASAMPSTGKPERDA